MQVSLWWLSDSDGALENEVRPLLSGSLDGIQVEFVEPGEIESAEILKLEEVRSRSSSGISILEIVPEGTVVKKGDFFGEIIFLQKDLLARRISVHQAKAALVKATADYEASQTWH